MSPRRLQAGTFRRLSYSPHLTPRVFTDRQGYPRILQTQPLQRVPGHRVPQTRPHRPGGCQAPSEHRGTSCPACYPAMLSATAASGEEGEAFQALRPCLQAEADVRWLWSWWQKVLGKMTAEVVSWVFPMLPALTFHCSSPEWAGVSHFEDSLSRLTGPFIVNQESCSLGCRPDFPPPPSTNHTSAREE